MAKKIKKKTSSKIVVKARRKLRIRKRVMGSALRPRLCVIKSNRVLAVQLINDDVGSTILSLQTPKGKTANVKLATELGKQIAQSALSKGIQTCVFDRSGNLYHGRVAAVATGAREAGLQF